MIIKNYGLLAKSRQRKRALQVIEAGLKAIDVRGAVKKAKLPSLKRFENVYVLGFGKAAAAMAEALEERLGNKIVAGAVVSLRKAGTKRIKGFKGTHPLPGKENVQATRKILEIAGKAGKTDLVIALVSGGGSSLLAMPAKHLYIGALQRTNQLLLNSNAAIDEINIVRKHISAVKGGLLMKAVYPATMYSLIVSDVVGDDLETIASGPSVADSSTFEQAIAVLRKYRLWEKAPKNVRKRLTDGTRGEIAETPKPKSRIFRKAKNVVILNNAVALKAMQKKAGQFGFKAVIYSRELGGEASHTGRFLLRNALALREKSDKAIALISAGETTVTLKGKGIGGRNQEIVLGCLEDLQTPEKAVLVSIASDGIDGNSKAAGAIADEESHERALRLGLNARDFLQRNDSFSFFNKLKDAVFTGEMDCNVSDFQVVLLG